MYCSLPESAGAFWLCDSRGPEIVPEAIVRAHQARWITFYTELGIDTSDVIPAGQPLGASLSRLLGQDTTVVRQG